MSSSVFGTRQFLQEQQAIFCNLQQLPPSGTDWIWPGWLARRHVHVLLGAQGVGSTALLLLLGATVSRGSQWPDGSVAPEGNVLFWAAGDSVRESLRSRAIAQGAQGDRLVFRGEEPFSPAVDVLELDTRMSAIPGLALVLIDAVNESKARTRSADSARDFKQIKRLAEVYNAAVVLTMREVRPA